MKALEKIVLALWLGSAFFLAAIAAPAAFRGASDSTIAANIVGIMIERWHYIALAAPVLLLVIGLRRGMSTARVVVLALAILFAVVEAGLDLKIRQVRASSLVPIGQLSRLDPVRRHFGMLHGISSTLLLLQIVTGVAYSFTRDERSRDDRSYDNRS